MNATRKADRNWTMRQAQRAAAKLADACATHADCCIRGSDYESLATLYDSLARVLTALAAYEAIDKEVDP